MYRPSYQKNSKVFYTNLQRDDAVNGRRLTETELVIFDWDGTLMDSRAAIVATMYASLADLGFTQLAEGEIQHVIGLGLREAVAELLPGVSSRVHEQACQRYRERFQAVEAHRIPLFEGVDSGLQQLQRQGRKLAIATGKTREGLTRMLDSLQMRDMFIATRCADETQSKPAPRMVWELLEETGMNCQQAVLVGDTRFDMEMAARADMPRVAVTYGMHAPEYLAPWMPDAWAESFFEVVELLNGTGSKAK